MDLYHAVNGMSDENTSTSGYELFIFLIQQSPGEAVITDPCCAATVIQGKMSMKVCMGHVNHLIDCCCHENALCVIV